MNLRNCTNTRITAPRNRLALVLLVLTTTGLSFAAERHEARLRQLVDIGRRIDRFLERELTYTDPQTFAALRDEMVKKDAVRLRAVFEERLLGLLDDSLLEAAPEERARRVLGILRSCRTMPVDEYGDGEIVLAKSCRAQLEQLLSVAQSTASRALSAMAPPDSFRVDDEIILQLVRGHVEDGFYAMAAPCTRRAGELYLQEIPECGGATGGSPVHHPTRRGAGAPLGCIDFRQAAKLAETIRQKTSVALELPTADQALDVSVRMLALWTRTVWKGNSQAAEMRLRYGVEMKTVVDAGRLLGPDTRVGELPFARYKKMGVLLVASRDTVRSAWLRRLRREVGLKAITGEP